MPGSNVSGPQKAAMHRVAADVMPSVASHHLSTDLQRASVQAATPHTVRSVASHPSARHDVLTAHTPHSQHQLRGSAATSQPSHLRSPALAQLTSPFQSAPHVQNVEPNVLPLAPAVSAPSTTGAFPSLPVLLGVSIYGISS